MNTPDLRVAVHACDPVTNAGLAGILSRAGAFTVVPGPGADVLVAAEDPAGQDLPVLRRAVTELGVLPAILIAGPLPPWGHRSAADAGCGACCRIGRPGRNG